MRHALSALAFTLLAMPALAAPVPTFTSPQALLQAVYAQMETWDEATSFDETETFSADLTRQYQAADKAVNPDGDMMGVLDFSPFIDGQDSYGLTYDIGQPKIKGTRAKATVQISAGDEPYSTLDFDMVKEADGWKVDDISSRPQGDAGEGWTLSEIFADAMDGY